MKMDRIYRIVQDFVNCFNPEQSCKSCLFLSGNNEPRRGDERRERQCHPGRQQAIFTESVKHERLYVKEPERHDQHRRDEYGQSGSRARVTENGQRRKTEGGKVGRRAECGGGNAGDGRIMAAEHGGTTGSDRTPDALPGEMLNRQIDRVYQTD